jgi:RasGEF domain
LKKKEIGSMSLTSIVCRLVKERVVSEQDAFLLAYRAFASPTQLFDIIESLHASSTSTPRARRREEGVERNEENSKRRLSDPSLRSKQVAKNQLDSPRRRSLPFSSDPGDSANLLLDFLYRWCSTCFADDFHGHQLCDRLLSFVEHVHEQLDDPLGITRFKLLLIKNTSNANANANANANGNADNNNNVNENENENDDDSTCRAIKSMVGGLWQVVNERVSSSSLPRSSPFGLGTGSEPSVAAVASELTLMMFALFERIELEELRDMRWLADDRSETAPHVTMLAALFNRVAAWVATEVLLPDAPKRRVAALRFFVRLAKALLKLANFEGVMAVVAGLNNVAVLRLKGTWAALPAKYVQSFDKIELLMSPRANFREYKLELASRRRKEPPPPAVPYVAPLLRDIVHLYDGNRDRLASADNVDFDVLQMLGRQLQQFKTYQRLPFMLSADPEIRFLLVNAPVLIDDDLLYRMSLMRQQPSSAAVTMAAGKSLSIDLANGNGGSGSCVPVKSSSTMSSLSDSARRAPPATARDSTTSPSSSSSATPRSRSRSPIRAAMSKRRQRRQAVHRDVSNLSKYLQLSESGGGRQSSDQLSPPTNRRRATAASSSSSSSSHRSRSPSRRSPRRPSSAASRSPVSSTPSLPKSKSGRFLSVSRSTSSPASSARQHRRRRSATTSEKD